MIRRRHYPVPNCTQSLGNSGFSHTLPSHPALSRVSQISCPRTIGNTNFLAVARNSPNKAGALVTINEMLSPQVQASRYEELKILPVLNPQSLTPEEAALFDSADPGPGTIPQGDLLSHRLPEMPVRLVPIIEELWLEEVVGQ